MAFDGRTDWHLDGRMKRKVHITNHANYLWVEQILDNIAQVGWGVSQSFKLTLFLMRK
jgi:hypothetical protein